MTYPRPTLSQLRDQTRADIQSALPGADVLLRYSNLSILSIVMAGLANGHYGYLDWIARQSVPFTATEEALEGWAALKGVTRKAAAPAIGKVRLLGNNGATLPAGSPFLRNDGFAYTSTADATVTNAGIVDVPVIAVRAGVAGNADIGTAFALASGVTGIGANGSAFTPITGGADVEVDDALRSRMLVAYANPQQGGSASDYQQWALAVPGVTRCWITPGGMGPGTVVVYFMMDAAQAAHGGFPQGVNGVAAAESRDTVATGDQLALANALFAKQPVTPIVYAVAPQPNVIGFTIAGLSGASASLKTAIGAAIDAALLVGGRPGGKTNISAIDAAISAVNGSAGFVITSITATAGVVTPGTAGNIISNPGRLPQRGAITWA